jgi:hypothetical protein
MRDRNGNVWARQTARLTKLAHIRAPAFRWGVLAILAVIWLLAGYFGRVQPAPGDAKLNPLDAIYSTLGVLTYQDSYSFGSVHGPLLNLARYTGMAVPVVGLLFAFSGQLGQSLARLFFLGAGEHVVIAGHGRAALCLARDCARTGDVVTLIASGLPDETEWSLHKSGVMIISGDPTSVDVLRAARVAFASNVVAFTEDDTVNLRIEAAVRAASPKNRRRQPIVHVAMQSPILLQEAREMRQQIQRDQERAGAKEPPLEARPFSLDELAARKLVQERGPFMLQVGEAKHHPHPHIVLFGFDEAAEAVAVRALMSLWSARFGAPKITVVTPDPVDARNRFDARYPNARQHDLWKADIEFVQFDWRHRSVSESFLEEIEAKRGPANGIVVSTGQDSENIALSLGVLRACNAGLAADEAKALWPAPIYMKETSESEFSRQFASGDRTPDVDDAYIEAFGSYEKIATRAMILEGVLDAGAAMAHQIYQHGQKMRRSPHQRELEAMRRDWGEIGETYRNASRASADHAAMKLWDAGWQPAGEGVKGEAAPEMTEAEVERLAELEHTRWVAERMLSGWRPGDKRDNRLRVHPNLVAWSELSAEDRAKDADQVRAAMTLGRAMHKRGFVKRGAKPMS